MEKHDLDFLDVQRDPALRCWRTNFLNDFDRFVLIAAYLVNKDIHTHLAWKHDCITPPESGSEDYYEEMFPEYTGFLDRNLGFIQGVLDYFSWIDTFFFSKQLPNWVVHKDHVDLVEAFRVFDANYEKEEDVQEELLSEDYMERYHMVSENDGDDVDLLEFFFYWVGAVFTISIVFSFEIVFNGMVDTDDMDHLYYAWLNISQPVLSTLFFYYEQVDQWARSWLHGLDDMYSPNGPEAYEEMFFEAIVDNESLHRRLHYTSSLDEELLSSFHMHKHDTDWAFFSSVRKSWLHNKLVYLIPSLGIHSGLANYRLMSWIPYTFFFFWLLHFCFRARFRYYLARYIFFHKNTVGRQFFKFFDLQEGESNT